MNSNLHFYLFRDKRQQWRWNLVAANGRKLACSGEGYRRRIDLYNALVILRFGLTNVPVKVEPPKRRPARRKPCR